MNDRDELERQERFDELFYMVKNVTLEASRETALWIIAKSAFEYGIEFGAYQTAVYVGNPMIQLKEPQINDFMQKAIYQHRQMQLED